ncbi:glycoside hydrolase family 3 N-terminal domain-containing protein [Dyadobacter tibetensis]|uniref:glycoside hydrolase family 3 N-terminal domain-containing protein n=1 Tax=Dyadobacter tibetensis TaxID=1211851 RepID=UPI00046FA523|nr:glycoside hydrolase family 3 N-terminal domain-containing protein [Dyadobacter tibetensis]
MKFWIKKRSYATLAVLALIILSPAVTGALMLIHKSVGIKSEVVPTPTTPTPHKGTKKNSPILVLPESAWVDSTLNSLSLDEKIGQLFMVATYSNRDNRHYNYIDKLIEEYHLGGLIFFQGGPVSQARLSNRYQARSKVPLFIGIDGEWGLGMRLDSTISFPKQMVLGAIKNNELIDQMGEDIGRQCKRLGIHINFAPVSDINSNPKNPVIGVRSFGEDRENVTRKAVAYMKGLQRQRVIATAKHFPGHGDTGTDSHYTLPVLTHSSEQLTETDLYPYRRLIADSLMGVLSGHLYVPVLDNTPQLPSSLSSKVINGLLRKEMGFRGLVFTDAMNMRGVAKTGPAPEINLKALIAGNDVLLYPENVGETVARIKQAIASREISEKIIDDKVKRILQGKYWAGLNRYQPIAIENLYQDLNQESSQVLYRQLCQASITVVNNDKNLLPLTPGTSDQIATVSMGSGTHAKFNKMINFYHPMQTYSFYDGPESQQEISEMLDHLAPYSTVIVGINGLSTRPNRNYHVNPKSVSFVSQLKGQGKKVILCVFGTPYSLASFPEVDALVCANQDGAEQQELLPQILFGALEATGVLPVSVQTYKAGTGVNLSTANRLANATPESVGMNSKVLLKIDNVTMEAIEQKAFPGCQILVSRRGKIVYNRQFGTLDYRSTDPVNEQTLYDLASLTKVSATLQAVMLLYDRQQLDLDARASKYLPELIGTNKESISIRDLLLHQSGMQSFYPTLWNRTLTKSGGFQPEYYRTQPDTTFSLQVAPKLYAKSALRDSVWKWIVQSPLNNKRLRSGQYGFMYSDLGFLTLQKVVERITGSSLDSFVYSNIYAPLGLKHLVFKPLTQFPVSQIAPTELDNYYRNQLLRGTVHDQMAAEVGGVSGHAGLFGTAQDLAVLCQMNLWKGKYGDKQIFKSSTIPYFSRLYNEPNSRGLGWDKAPSSGNSSYVSDMVSPNSFGHTGFTGTMVWMDPDEDLSFIFLSNRVYPSARNSLINTHRIRRRIQETVYASITDRKSALP